MGRVTLSQEPNPALQSLSALIGEWLVEVKLPSKPPVRVLGRMSFGWFKDGAFLVMRTQFDDKAVPDSTFIIGKDDAAEEFAASYFDVRGVSRIYRMRFDGGVWRMWRDVPGFSQRFEGRISEKGGAIAAFWEKSADGVHWQRDFAVNYTKTK